MKTRRSVIFVILTALLVVLPVVDLAVGSVPIPLRQVWGAVTGQGDVNPTIVSIVLNVRLLKAIVAILAGMALSASGLQMQTLFRNPLAGPYVLGISAGASLGVALLVLGASVMPGLQAMATTVGIAGAAWIGAAVVLAVIGTLSRRVKDIMVVLIIGMMLSSAIGALVQVMQYLGNEQSLKSFVVWTMGSLGEVTARQMWIMAPAVVAGLLIALATVKPLNLLLFGEDYAVTMGLNVRRSRRLILISTTLLAGTVTAFCGPIGFIGLAMPHVARVIVADSNHRVLMPATLLTGANVMLCCDIVSKLFTLPVNAITSLVGIPVVISVVLRNR